MRKYLDQSGLNYLWQKIKYDILSGATGSFIQGTTGSIIYHNGTKWTSLNKGLSGQILHSNGDIIEWKDASEINALGYRYNTTTGAFAEGYNTTASGNNSHAEGRFTQALNNAEHGGGSYNISHKGRCK